MRGCAQGQRTARHGTGCITLGRDLRSCYAGSVFIVIQGRPRDGDTMILDSAAGHGRTFDALAAFLASSERAIEIAAAGTCHLCPDYSPLRAFRMVKTGDKLRTEELPDGVLQVSGRPDLLARYIEAFRFEPGAQDHHHPEQQEMFFGGLDRRSAAGNARHLRSRGGQRRAGRRMASDAGVSL
jgi:hypothetical protein